ncbi:hypothetical protein SKUN_00217 [Spiroplasma kunkelii CR2-3x]|uniref:Uncharacterized protein n=1 Tax=Spiroplasma kunkelii CR2-3x TaxID=273035 RepID=A0A0K2JEX9_SPIKU|nr:hypothetical protein [Spiroplasma kunkelii]ALA97139.1 hypothetical protein SKUN_00217 [Spiroplasma kunkelii CR2-3x]
MEFLINNKKIGKENTKTNINHSWKNNFGKENVEKDINYRWKGDYKTWTSDSSNTYELINWKDIADIKYINGFSYYFPTFVIDGTMSCGLYGGFGYISQYYSLKTALLSGTTNTIQFTCNAFVGPEHYTAIILKLWTSGSSIYWK